MWNGQRALKAIFVLNTSQTFYASHTHLQQKKIHKKLKIKTEIGKIGSEHGNLNKLYTL